MRTSLSLLGAAALLAMLGGCNRAPPGPGGLSAEDEQLLNNTAAMTNEVVDVSPDSMTANEEEVVEEEAGDAANGTGNGQ